MNYAVILAAGVGQRMRSGGMPKQFLKLMGKPIIIYTLEKFEQCPEIDQVIVVCHSAYLDLMDEYVSIYKLKKSKNIVVGGKNRQTSLKCGLEYILQQGAKDKDIVLIHDGVRPLIKENTIRENIRVAKKYGCAMTVHPVVESVVVTDSANAEMDNFMKRDDTYSLTSPQSFTIKIIKEILENYDKKGSDIPLLDAAMVYASTGGEVKLVKEQNNNLKVTTPEDFYFLKAILEMEECRRVFGL